MFPEDRKVATPGDRAGGPQGTLLNLGVQMEDHNQPPTFCNAHAMKRSLKPTLLKDQVTYPIFVPTFIIPGPDQHCSSGKNLPKWPFTSPSTALLQRHSHIFTTWSNHLSFNNINTRSFTVVASELLIQMNLSVPVDLPTFILTGTQYLEWITELEYLSSKSQRRKDTVQSSRQVYYFIMGAEFNSSPDLVESWLIGVMVFLIYSSSYSHW